MYKNLILLVVFLPGVSFVFSAESSKNQEQYNFEADILYRTAAEADKDDYIQQRCRLDIYYPTKIKDYPTVVWFHGGGITGGNKSVPEKLKGRGMAVVAANYRLSPKVKSPVYVEDAAAAVAWTFKAIEKYGGSRDKIYVSGHSAGGYLASMVGMDKSYLKKYGIDADDIAALLPFSGHTITHFTVRGERGIPGTRPIIDEMAPLYLVRPDSPPLVLITGDRELELLGRYEENAYMMRMMKVAGHKETILYELQGSDHGQMVSPAYEILLRYISSREK
ncbi:Lipase 2 [Limihaloglobus sulfuriphilus]|uniref:Lipase 2 n=1 Tax=Limihaloglobus sulfuriphilus TaxID=1851148 RepID=A0A1Q2MH28_9BACT|nr:alpha/beta hydrolase [Limihaloglobus sulfuriphilus]AQQ71838.1 Lipase 2 [Limihaloglobus sulfuriphilus]